MGGRFCVLLLAGSSIAPAAPACFKCVTPEFTSEITRIPANYTRRIVILGSSTAQGSGATDTAHSWVGLLTSWLAPRGFTIINQSISGSATKDSLNRFSQDVAPYRPDFVVLATSLWNEGPASNPSALRTAYMANTRKLIALADSIGAVPIVAGVFPNFGSSPAAVSVVKDIYADLESLGVPEWDFWSGLADPQGNWLPGLSADGTHPGNAGHRDLFDAIPASYFQAAYQPIAAAYDADGSWLTDVADNPPGQLTAQLDQPAGSWSVGAWLLSAPAAPQLVLTASGSGQLQLLRSSTGYTVTLNGATILNAASKARPEPSWRQVLLTYAKETNLLSLYVDGELLASSSVAASIAPARFTLGGDREPAHFGQFLLYRTALTADDAAKQATLTVQRKSLESWIALATSGEGGLVNYAGTATVAVATGAWTFDPAAIAGRCLYRHPPRLGTAACTTNPFRRQNSSITPAVGSTGNRLLNDR